MHILFVLHQFFPEFSGGTERVTLNLARMAQRAGHRVQVLACRVDPQRPVGGVPAALPGAVDSVFDGVPVTLLDRRTLPEIDSALADGPTLAAPLDAWLAEHRFDVVHALHPMRMGSVLAAVQRAGLPLLLTLTDYFAPCFRINLVDVQGQPCEGPEGGRACTTRCASSSWPMAALQTRLAQGEALLRQASACIAPSAHVARRYQEIYPGLAVEQIPHGVDLLAIAAARPTDAAARPLTLGFVGALIPPKGLHVLLAALRALPELPLRLQVAGHFHDEAYAQQIRQAAQQDARVQLLGGLAAPEVHALMHGLDLLCLPSLVPESFSLVVHEAAAAGVPALVSDLGAPAEAIGRSGAGAVVPAGAVDAWTQALRDWATQPERQTAWRRAVRLPMRIEEEAFLYESLYRSALSAVSEA